MVERAVRASRWKRIKARGQICLNCGAEVSTPFCPHCGQENVPCDLSLGAVLKELFSELAYYDSKLWHTLWTLVAFPGRLTSEWALGKRARFISPIRLYLSITFVYFVSLSYFSPKAELVNVQRHDSAKAVKESVDKAKKTIAVHPGIPDDVKSAIQINDDGDGGDPDASLRKLGWFGLQIRKIRFASTTEAGRASIQRGFFDQIPKVLFILLPVFAGVTKLLYWRPKRYYVEHLVFMLHIHSFAFLALFLGGVVPIGGFQALLFFGVLLYDYVAMLRFYKQPWYLTGLKAGFLGVTYLIFLGLGALLATLFLAQSLPMPPNLPTPPPVTTGTKTASPNPAVSPSNVSGTANK